ncbi:unnamed protein product [Cylicostephanus goldi]|uniref:EF-hand domain-containing protein n=1 Tax=Cylicostephanus goldi TaxID=71465 RepID=A0A3P7MZA2_CYLGO|nr:unnamed protein product [Cylicostephanus goldi]
MYHSHDKTDGLDVHVYHSIKSSVTVPVFTDEEIEEVVDPILKSYDINGDGFIEFAEFRAKTVM